MKKILSSLVLMALVATSAIGATRAYFSDTEEMTGLTFSTGNANLKMASVSMGRWFDGNATAEQLLVSLPENLYPGYQGSWGDPDGVIYLGNFSVSPIDLVVNAMVTNYTSENSLLDDTVEMAIAWGGNCDPGGVGTGFHSLKWWRNNSVELFTGSGETCGYIPNDHSAGYNGYARSIKIYLRVPETATNNLVDSNATFNIFFDALQRPEVEN